MIKIKKIQSFPRLQVLAFVASVVAALILLWLSQLTTDELVESRHLVQHTYGIVSKLEELHGSVESIETSRLGYQLTHQDQYLRPYYQDQKHIFKELAPQHGRALCREKVS